ncbi:MAG: germination protein YpeB [Firmicutes bacterium]|nr:germination protein YpeB [Bacillota bacterium]
MKLHENRRAVVRLVSFLCAVLLILSGFTYVGYSAANRYRTRLENSCRRSFEELSTYLSNIEAALTKSLYSNSLPEQTLLAARLLRDAGCAKEALSQLPLEQTPLDRIYRFLSQTGEFAVSLSVRLSAGETLRTEDYDSLALLHSYARTLSASLQDCTAGLLSGENGNWYFVQKLSAENEVLPSVTDGFREMESGFEDYPTLIYDGPFSDHILQQTPRMTEGKSDYGEDAAAAAAKSFLSLGNVPAGDLTLLGTSRGNLAVYSFALGELTIDVTRAGPYVARVIDPRPVEKTALSVESARKNARIFLSMQGYSDFQESYYSVNDHICTVNFAAQQDGVTCYPDLIKVSIAMDNGSIVLFDACGYLMNHMKRDLAEPKLSAEEARQRLSPALIPAVGPGLAVVPTAGGGEAFCYEFRCTGVRGETVLVYLDTQTGLERQLLILLQSDNGVLTI